MAKISIEQINDFLASEGNAMHSACDDEAAGIALAREFCPGKPYCSVRQWILVDLDISDDKKALITEQGESPRLS